MAVIDIRKQHPEISGFSATALLPLIREPDPKIQQKVISIIKNAGKEKMMNYGTERKMKAALKRHHDPVIDSGAHTQEFKELEPKKLNKVEAMECMSECIKTLREGGVGDMVIEGLYLKAIHQH